MASATVSFRVEARPADVWRVVGERWDEMSRLVPTISHSELVDGTEVGAGAARRCTLSNPVAGMEYVEERLVEWDPPATFLYEVIDPPFGMRRLGNRWTVEPSGTATRLTMEPFVELRGRPLTRPFERLVLRWMIRDLRSDVEEMRTRVERAANESTARPNVE